MKRRVVESCVLAVLLAACLPAASQISSGLKMAAEICLTSLFPDDEHELRDELFLQQLGKEALRGNPAITADMGNIVVMEDDGLTVIPENPFPLDRLSMLWAPNDTGSYDVLSERFSFDRTLGDQIDLVNDDSQEIEFPSGFNFTYFGVPYTSVYVNSNGNLAFRPPNLTPAQILTYEAQNLLAGESVAVFYTRRQISPFWDDLDPSASGGVYVKRASDRVVVTWNGVPEFGIPNSNTFQVVLFADGRIRFAYGAMSALDGLVGLSAGSGVNVTSAVFKNLPIRGARGPIVELFSPAPGLSTQRVAQRFFQDHPDDFDIVTMWTNFDMGGASAFYQPIRNEIRGIGRRINDNSRQYGSQGRLNGVVFMNDINVWPADPLARIAGGTNANSTISILAQELGHRWLADVRFNDDGVMSNELIGRQLAHWSFFTHAESAESTPERPISSSVEGNVWRDNGDGTFTSTNLIDGYSPLDQYLMGLRGPEEVPDFFVISSPSEITRTRGAGPFPNVVVRGQKKTVSIRQVIEAEGPRIPDAANSQKKFRSAFVLVTRRGATANAEELARLDRVRTEWEKYFLRHTGGRGSFDTTLRPAGGITSIAPLRGIPGARLDAEITGVGLAGATAVVMAGSGVTVTVRPGGTDTALPITIAIAANASGGTRRFQVATPRGMLDSEGLFFDVSNYVVLATGFAIPRGIALNEAGDIFVSNSGDGTISRINARGEKTVFARGLLGTIGLAFNRAGELFVAESVGRVSRLSSNGLATPFATDLASPTQMAFDSAGNLFVLNTGPNNVMRIDPEGRTSVFAAIPLAITFGGIALDSNNNVYVSAYGSGNIFRFTPGAQMTTAAILPPNTTDGLLFDRAGNLYVGDANGSITRIEPSGNAARISEGSTFGPVSFAADTSGRIYAVSFTRAELIRFSPSIAVTPAAQPSIASVSPVFGAPGTTFNATLAGTGLTSATVVAITGGGVRVAIRPGGNTSVVPVTITIDPGAEPGARQVVVTTPAGTGTSGNAPNFSFGSAVIAFAVQQAPAITSISPSNPSAGQFVRISGTGFEDLFSEFINVTFVQGSRSAGAGVITRTGSQIVVTAPSSLRRGSANVVVSRSTSPAATTTSNLFAINIADMPAPPEIRLISPSEPGPGQRVTLEMAGLPAAGTVTLAVQQFGRASFITGTSVTNLVTSALAALPSDLASGPAQITATVTIGAKTSNPSAPFHFVVSSQPAALEIATIRSNIRGAGQLITIATTQSGGFAANPEDNIAIFTQNGKTVTSRAIGFQGALLVVPVPAGLAPGTVEVRVSSATAPLPFVIRLTLPSNPVTMVISAAPPAPVIVSIGPPAAPPGGAITINGLVGHFSPRAEDNTVTFQQSGMTVAVTALTANSFGSQIMVRVPSALSPGAVDLWLTVSVNGVASAASVPRRMTVAGGFVINVPAVTRGFNSLFDDVMEPGITLVNTSPETAAVTFSRYLSTGAPVLTTASPVERILRPGEQLATTIADLFILNTSSTPFSGWMKIQSNVELKGAFGLFDRNFNRAVDSVSLNLETSPELVFRYVEKEDASATNSTFALINGNDQPASVDLEEFDQSGVSRSKQTVTIASNGSSLLAAEGGNRRGGYARVKSSLPVSGIALIGNTDRLTLLKAAGSGGMTQFVIPFFAAGEGFDTRVNFTNAGSAAADVSASAFDAGQRSMGNLQQSVGSNRQTGGPLAAVFSVPADPQLRTGYIAGTSTAGIRPYAEITFTLENSIVSSTAVESDVPSRRLIFPTLINQFAPADGKNLLAGLSLVNAGNTPASAQVTVFDMSGRPVASTTLSLSSGQQVTKLLSGSTDGSGFFAGLNLETGYLTVTSNVPVAAALIVFREDLRQMFAIQGQPF